MKSLRFWAVCLLLLATAALLQSRGTADVFTPSLPLSELPYTIDGLQGTDQPIDPEQLEYLGPGDYLVRVYTQGRQVPPVGLYIAYFPTQRTGNTIHSPKHCLPGAGWSFESSKYVILKDANGKPHQVGEYIIYAGANKQFVIYWYEAHGRSVANEYMAKIYLATDAIRMNRTDGALVRVITPIVPSTGIEAAKARAEEFTAQLWPMLPRFIPN